MHVNALRFQGMIALNTKQVGHAKINQIANAAGTEAVARDPKGRSYAIEISKADDPDSATKDSRFIAAELLVDNTPFAYDPTSEGRFELAGDIARTSMEDVMQALRNREAFNFKQPAPEAKKPTKPPVTIAQPFKHFI